MSSPPFYPNGDGGLQWQGAAGAQTSTTGRTTFQTVLKDPARTRAMSHRWSRHTDREGAFCQGWAGFELLHSGYIHVFFRLGRVALRSRRILRPTRTCTRKHHARRTDDLREAPLGPRGVPGCDRCLRTTIASATLGHGPVRDCVEWDEEGRSSSRFPHLISAESVQEN